LVDILKMKNIFDKIEKVCKFEIIDQERIQDVRTGVVYKITDNGGKVWAVKITPREQIYGDVYFYEKIRKTNICVVPEVIFFEKVGKKYVMVMEWIKRDVVEKLDFDLGKDIGEKIRKIHEIKVNGCGQRDGKGWQYSSWDEFMKMAWENNIKNIENLNCEEKFKKTVLEKCEKGLGNLEKVEPKLCHGDLGIDNMIIRKNELFGLLDTGWIVGGDGLTDIAYLVNGRHNNKNFIDGLRSGYGRIDEDNLVFYRLLTWLGKIDFYLRTNKEEKYKRTSREIVRLADGWKI